MIVLYNKVARHPQARAAYRIPRAVSGQIDPDGVSLKDDAVNRHPITEFGRVGINPRAGLPLQQRQIEVTGEVPADDFGDEDF